MLDVKPLSRDRLADLQQLFGGDRSVGFLLVHVVHHRREGVSPGRRAGECRKVQGACRRLGAAARGDRVLDGEPVGWAAAGPRSRYARAVRTPTLKGVDHSEDDDVWLAPCFFVRRDKRGHGRGPAAARGRGGACQGLRRRGDRGVSVRGREAGRRRPSGGDRGAVRGVRLSGGRASFAGPRHHAARLGGDVAPFSWLAPAPARRCRSGCRAARRSRGGGAASRRWPCSRPRPAGSRCRARGSGCRPRGRRSGGTTSSAPS